VFAVQPLAEAEARTALQREAQRRGIALSCEVVDHLLTRFDRNLAHLMALLDRLDDFALAEQRGVTVPLLKKMLAEQAEQADPIGPLEAAAAGHARTATDPCP
jgi:DnaA family protein